MQELTFEQVEEVSGGGDSIDYINLASDVLTLGMAGARVLTMATPLGWGLAGVTLAYYGGQWIGSKLVN
ncbi:hypothetical protein [Rheinheimera sp. MMS21-TC3]|uniref:hypothetical protein n=1 Tax=Rheinheimera sp. MMS21-TC3 TaxID=3072790 RepID=UPI0028C40964|nr:hypothetical protein [Rheinheimera sp. MMS21-TC3]WNO59769.1 hypothetical protein RDV63_02065 [Rheinheimera sp. MMS21-TC3]